LHLCLSPQLESRPPPQAATDPRTGLIDMDTINTGHSASERRLLDEGCTALKAFLTQRAAGRGGLGPGGGIFFKQLLGEFTQQYTQMRVTELDLKKMLLHLEREEQFLLFNSTGAGSMENPVIRLQNANASAQSRDDEAQDY
jgi:hypothetical protein